MYKLQMQTIQSLNAFCILSNFRADSIRRELFEIDDELPSFGIHSQFGVRSDIPIRFTRRLQFNVD